MAYIYAINDDQPITRHNGPTYLQWVLASNPGFIHITIVEWFKDEYINTQEEEDNALMWQTSNTFRDRHKGKERRVEQSAAGVRLCCSITPGSEDFVK